MRDKDIGLFLCDCSGRINKIDKKKLENFFRNFEINFHSSLCSSEGKEFLKEKVKISPASRFVIAACTPKFIESVFQRVIKEAGKNPYLLTVVNLREQCDWVTSNPEEATEKAIEMIKASISRVKKQVPLEEVEYKLCDKVLVVGGGWAGIYAATSLVKEEGRKVFLVEKEPFLGGKSIKIEKIAPTFQCASCAIEKNLGDLMDYVEKGDIKLFLNSEVKDIKGTLGGFKVKVVEKPRYVEISKCMWCGECIEACEVEVKNEYEFGRSMRKAIFIPYYGMTPHVPVISKEDCLHWKNGCEACKNVCAMDAINFQQDFVEHEIEVGAIILATGYEIYEDEKFEKGRVLNSLEFERMIAEHGFTNGKIEINGSVVRRIGILFCYGRESLGYCSKYCCIEGLKFAHEIKNKVEDAEIYMFYRDKFLPDKKSKELFESLKKESNIKWIKVDEVKIEEEKNCVKVNDIDLELLVTLNGLKLPSFIHKIAKITEMEIRDSLLSPDFKLSPHLTTAKGIYLASRIGTLEDTLLQSLSCVAEVFSNLPLNKTILLSPLKAKVSEGLCGGCKLCISACPYRAIEYNEEKGIAIVNSLLCENCGVCAATCPSLAIQPQGFTHEQIVSEIVGEYER